MVLLSSDGRKLYLWNPTSRRERELAVPALASANIFAIAASFDGRFLVVESGSFGQQVWKVPLAAPQRAEKVFELDRGQTMDGVVVNEANRILVAPQAWIGELFAVTGRFD